MFSIAVFRNHILVFCLSISGFLVTIITAINTPIQSPGFFFTYDQFGLVFIILINSACLVISMFSFSYLSKHNQNKEEFYLLLLTSTLGASSLAISGHFIPFFISLELLTVSLYVLIGYFRESELSSEAAVKYLVMAALSSAFLLFGMALVYSDNGTMNFNEISLKVSQFSQLPVFTLMGLCLIITGIGFKLGWVPFHQWTPDIYQGASAPVAGIIATISKGAVFAVFMRLYFMLEAEKSHIMMAILSTLAILSMIIGNLLALRQSHIRRLLAYSSIAHLGYLLTAFISGKEMGLQASVFYFIVYFIAILGSFGVIILLSDFENIEDYKGLYYRHPFIALVFSTMLLSLAGLPLTGGFIGKYYIIASGIYSGLWGLMMVLILSSIIGLFYYLQIIVSMFTGFSESDSENPVSNIRGMNFLLLGLVVILIWIGVYPSLLLNWLDLIKSQ